MRYRFDGPPIARRTTTCGGVPHSPAPIESEDSKRKAARCDARRLPERILRAIALVYESDGLRALHITNRQVLATLIRFALNQKDPTSLAFIKKATIAQHLSISEATVYRALGTLEDAGLIERERQQRTRAQLEVVGRIGFTAKLLQCIGLAGRELGYPEPQTGSDESRSSSACLAPVSGVNNPKQSSTKKHSGPREFVQIHDRAVPIDLAPLVRDQELTTSALFLLMRLAREAGHRLSDVVSAAGHVLGPLRGRELFAYLKSLLGKPIDYSYVVQTRKAQEDERRATAAQAAQDRLEVAQLVERYRGRRVSAPDGRIYEVDSASIVITEANGRRSSLGHDQARAWLIEMDRAATGLSRTLAQPSSATRSSSAMAQAAIEQLRGILGGRPPPNMVGG
ncbi:helix-turn-helix domain-containing protein [Cupriavidus oxalaticus]|uniref:DNA-binding protein n=1 Tax=Cupriavidus oxalaticus TaxID=96344 RepID=A0A5P3VUE1_9BURK|nr:helix-turn-helix domain-containing protein [Cupriavidus oxalaticus]QEZ48881.1 DNA-binding protein [Cupriavidus oxalaticus]